MIATNPAEHLSSIEVKNNAVAVRPFEPKEYEAIIAAIDKTTMTEVNKARIRACMQLQRFSGLSLVDAVCLASDELVHEGDEFRIQRKRQETDSPIDNLIPSWLGKELLAIKNGNSEYVFWNGTATPKGAVSSVDKLYRKVFKTSGLTAKRKCGSHDFRHTFAVGLLKKGTDVRLVSKALGHSSVQITERYYAKWCKHQQKMLDKAISAAWE
jgi:integrase